MFKFFVLKFAGRFLKRGAVNGRLHDYFIDRTCLMKFSGVVNLYSFLGFSAANLKILRTKDDLYSPSESRSTERTALFKNSVSFRNSFTSLYIFSAVCAVIL